MAWLVVAVLFAAAWVWAFYREDRLEREPVWMVGLAFLWGMVAMIPALFLENQLLRQGLDPGDSLAMRAVALFLVVGPVEELCKFAAVRLHIYSHAQFNEPMDGIVYSVSAASGFALVENVRYMEGMPEVIWARGPAATLAHILFAGFWGSALGWTKAMENRRTARLIVAGGLLWAASTHGLFDLIYFTADRELPLVLARIALVAVIVASFLALRFQMRRALALSPFRRRPDFLIPLRLRPQKLLPGSPPSPAPPPPPAGQPGPTPE
jgi:RsiW-degrading membrane proteinase PrsW (M82 family)